MLAAWLSVTYTYRNLCRLKVRMNVSLNRTMEYSAALTGEPFLYHELKMIARLKNQGLSDEEIKSKAQTGNLIQYGTSKSAGKMASAVLRRAAVLDPCLLDWLVNGSLRTSKIIAVYTIMKTNRLFYEFMDEVYKEKYMSGDPRITRKDLGLFFAHKAEQSERVAGWKDQTVNKLRQVYTRILSEAGFVDTNREITPPVLEEQLTRHLLDIGDERFVRVLSGGSYHAGTSGTA